MASDGGSWFAVGKEMVRSLVAREGMLEAGRGCRLMAPAGGRIKRLMAVVFCAQGFMMVHVTAVLRFL